MTNFTRRQLTEAERFVRAYEDFVDSLCEDPDYGPSLFEYANDIECRQYLAERRTDPEVARMWTRVANADSRLKPLLVPTKQCIRGTAPRSSFWFWGFPAGSAELQEELAALGML
jgi:hypothetical protein